MKRPIAAVALFPLAAAAALEALSQGPPVQFEARADLILIDANVVDGQGVPVPDLTRDDFVISVDGAPRPIASIQFVTNAPAASAAPNASHYSTNEGVSAGRRIMILVDENSIAPGGARGVLMSIDRLLTDLAPSDQVGFIRLPHFEDPVDFTADRQRVLDAVKKTTGKALRAGFGRVSVSEAAAFDRGDTFEWQRAITRICSGIPPSEIEFCRQEAESDASDKSSTYKARARDTVNAIGQVLSNLRQVPGPKTVVLLSQGFVSYELRADIVRVAELAAAARVSLYAIHIDLPAVDMEASGPSLTRADDERLLTEGIDTLAGASRGARFRVVGTGESIFARVARELSGYYLIGLEPTASDRDGKPHRIRVEVKRRGTTVRARAQFTIATDAHAASARGAPAEQLLRLLRAAAPESAVLLRLAAFATPGSSANRVKVIVAAEIGGPTMSPVEVQLGFVLVDAEGRMAANQFMEVRLRPDRGEDQPAVPRFVGDAEVPPGDYIVRLAVIDRDGRAGSVHHPVSARLKEAGDLGVSDLVLARSLRTGTPRPEVHVNLEEPVLHAYIEMAGYDSQLAGTSVAFDISSSEGGEPLVSERGEVRDAGGRNKLATAKLDVGALPPGRYLARAVVSVPGHKPLIAARPFEVAPRAPVAASTGSGGSASTAASRGRARPPIPPFKPQDVLAPAVVTPFIDHVLATYSPSPAAREALNAIRSGDLRAAARGGNDIGDVGSSFARGLALLAENRAVEANAYFRAALRSASDFIGAAFYLGATLAAAGKDRDAVGAWQTALISEVGAAGIYPVLIDGLLRLGEAEQALQTLEEAEPTFADRTQFDRRLVQAYALMGRYVEALPIAHAYLTRQPGDTDMLFLTMHIIYEALASGALADPAPEVSRFREYADKYRAAAGAQTMLVEGWRKALGIR